MKTFSQRFTVLPMLLLPFFLAPQKGQAEGGQEFLLSCTYGILAGALVGAASLAMEDDPGSKVHRVARGASLGLYSGLLLGAYVVYVVPAQLDSQDADDLKRYQERVLPGDYGQVERPSRVLQKKVIRKPLKLPKLALMPVVENHRITGAALTYNISHF